MNHRLTPLEQAFPRRKRPVLMTGLVVGDPYLEATEDYLKAVVAGGADVVELIVPFSDAAFHGPVLRRACGRAMSEEVAWDDVEALIAEFRKVDDETPLVVSSYFNRILAREPGRCVAGLDAAGADAVLVTDLPAEESHDFRREVEGRQMALLQTVAPTTTTQRFRKLAARARGLLLWTGDSGAEVDIDIDEFRQRVRQLRQYTALPFVASMNVESGRDAAVVADVAHGVWVSSSLAWLIEGKGPEVDERLEAFVAELRTSLDQGMDDTSRQSD